jgi:hypothetical protein
MKRAARRSFALRYFSLWCVCVRARWKIPRPKNSSGVGAFHRPDTFKICLCLLNFGAWPLGCAPPEMRSTSSCCRMGFLIIIFLLYGVGLARDESRSANAQPHPAPANAAVRRAPRVYSDANWSACRQCCCLRGAFKAGDCGGMNISRDSKNDKVF